MSDKEQLAKTYDPKSFERKWYRHWEEHGYFHQDVDTAKQPYSIVIPPPNVTGQLHMGHAMDETLQDILARWRRMQGYNTLWLPGYDHAGIATQAKVEQSLRENEHTTRYDLGREKFLERVWAWKEKYGDRIVDQLRLLGSSCDWSRQRFTMDEGCSRAVREVFVSLYEQGLIYRGTRITNWCPECNTALSDIEVEHVDEGGHLWHVRYPFAEGDGCVEVATTRPETMFGDTAVAVHPDDERYKGLVGKMLLLPIVNRRIPLIADEAVDKDFGTGALKVTPAHAPEDFEIGLRHHLEQVSVINRDGTMSAGAGKYEGLDRDECRRQVVEELRELGLLASTEAMTHAVGHCSRCHATVEPLISEQWFVKMDELAKPAIEAVRDGRIRFVPERFGKIYVGWLAEIRDWCISRQLWWGHRIPAWYCDECGATSVSRDDLAACPKCGSARVHQDEDVLDTWFSSGLWPFETMGWPEHTAELKQWYPTATLVTGYDIIFFWVARMVMMGLRFAGDIPFRHVFIHGLVRDSEGRKMSKSLGNGIDPAEVIDKYGADTLRFMLMSGNTPGNDLRFYWERVEGARNFANKLWNASRFMLMNLEGFDRSVTLHPLGNRSADYTLADRWILSRYAKAVAGVNGNLEKFELGEAARTLYDFIWGELCDWYIELVKPRLYDKGATRARATAQSVLAYVLEGTLRLLHPFMPFITEEIWQRVPHVNGASESIMVAEYPRDEAAHLDDDAETQMAAIMDSIKAIRNLRAEAGAAPGHKSAAVLHFADDQLRAVFAANLGYVATLAASEPVSLESADAPKPQNAMTAVAGGVEIYLPLAGLIDVDKELARLAKENETLTQNLAAQERKLANEKFVSRAPHAVVEGERKKLDDYRERQRVVAQRLAYLRTLAG